MQRVGLLSQRDRSMLEKLLSTPQKRGRVRKKDKPVAYLQKRLSKEAGEFVAFASLVFTLENMRIEALQRGKVRLADEILALFSNLDSRDHRFRFGYCDCETCEE